MTKVEQIILHDNYPPSICEWRKNGVYLVSRLGDQNLDEMFKLNSFETMDFLDNLIDMCDNKKNYLQLSQIKNYFKYEFQK